MDEGEIESNFEYLQYPEVLVQTRCAQSLISSHNIQFFPALMAY